VLVPEKTLEGVMALRPIWRGHLRLALVSCPVALYSAHREAGNLRFNMINPKTGNRIKMITQDAETDEPLSRRDLVKGYEFKKDHYLILTDEDFESARVESSSNLTVEKFVDADTIDPLYYDTSYYVAPDGDAGKDVYAVLREAIKGSGRVALSRVTISGRERAIAFMPMDGGMVAHTLNEERDVNDAKPLFEGLDSIKVDPEMVKLATQLIDRQTGEYDPKDVEDRYEARLREVIEAKLKGEGIEPVAEEAPQSNVIDLMSALRKSLGDEKAEEKKPAAARGKAPAGKEKEDKKAPPRKAAEKEKVRKRA
jgi:DNA end-binding protein Ku